MSTKGLKFSEETRRKMSEAHKGKKRKPHTEESKEKIRQKKKGIPLTHLVDYWTGRKQTEEHRLKTIKNLTHRFKKGMVSPMKGKKNKGVSSAKHWKWKGGISPQYQKLRTARIKQNGGSHTLGEWENLKVQYGYTCPMCLKKEPDIKLTKDHVIPLTKGGSDFIENIQPLCISCNSKKNNKLIERLQVPKIT